MREGVGGTGGGPEKERLRRDPRKDLPTLGINKHQLSQRNLPPGKQSRERRLSTWNLRGKGEIEPKGPPCVLKAALLGFLCLPLATRPGEVGLCSEGRGHRSHGMESKGSTLHVLVGPILLEGVFPEGLQEWDPIFAHHRVPAPSGSLEEPALPLQVWCAPWAIGVGVVSGRSGSPPSQFLSMGVGSGGWGDGPLIWDSYTCALPSSPSQPFWESMFCGMRGLQISGEGESMGSA